MKQDDFASKVAERMDAFRLHPSSQVWQRVEDTLRKKRRRRFLWWMMTGAVGTGALIWLMIMTASENGSPSPEPIADAVQQNVRQQTMKAGSGVGMADDRNDSTSQQKSADRYERSSDVKHQQIGVITVTNTRKIVRTGVTDKANTRDKVARINTGRPTVSNTRKSEWSAIHSSTPAPTEKPSKVDEISKRSAQPAMGMDSSERTASVQDGVQVAQNPSKPAMRNSSMIKEDSAAGPKHSVSKSTSVTAKSRHPWIGFLGVSAGMAHIGGASNNYSGVGISWGIERTWYRPMGKGRTGYSIGLGVQGMTTAVSGNKAADLSFIGNFTGTMPTTGNLNPGLTVLHRLEMPLLFHWQPSRQGKGKASLALGITPGYIFQWKAISTTADPIPLRRLQWALSLDATAPFNRKTGSKTYHFLRLQAGLTDLWNGTPTKGSRPSFIQYGIRRQLR